ncbi:MAG: glycolate oxidase subunit GlcE [Acetobacteraceae bacterium]|nr:glycolate oxidase subunit GlcE [Acetobacteraceae bacterium]
MPAFQAKDAKQIGEVIAWAAAEEQPLEVRAGGSKRALGRQMQTEHVLDISALSGITEYEAPELVLTAGAATPLAEIDAALAQKNQMIAFEPADWRHLLGADGTKPTIGGVLACNLSGPRRIKAGAARDHFLGFQAVNGRGELFKAGGKVVKNVTGYDLNKLYAGAYGTLGVLTEVTIKVLPKPETVRTVLVPCLEDTTAIEVLTEGLNSPHEVSGAAYLPPNITRRSQAGTVAQSQGGVALLRVEGPEPSTAYRSEQLTDMLGRYGPAALLGESETERLWEALRDVRLLAEPPDRYVWRLSVTPSRGASVACDIARSVDAEYLLDWGGGLIWVSISATAPDAGADAVRTAVRTHGGGHATLVRAPENVRAAVSVFEPLPGPLAALTARVKEGFDPRRILNPGRMYAGI